MIEQPQNPLTNDSKPIDEINTATNPSNLLPPSTSNSVSKPSRPKKPRKKSNINQNASEIKQDPSKLEEIQISKEELVENIIPLHPEIVSFKNNVKNYINEFKSILTEGLDQHKITISTKFIEKIKQEFLETSEEDKLRLLLERLLAPIIDSKPFNKLTELIENSKEYVNSITDKFQSWDKDKYMDFIMNSSERKNYLERMKLFFPVEEINNQNFYIFEIKNLDNLTYYADMTEVQNTRRKRVYKMSLAERLYRLIQNIEKAKTQEDLEKTNKALDTYYKKKNEKLKLLENKPITSEKKRKTPLMKDSAESKEAGVNKTLKKLKIDSDKESFLSNRENLSDPELNETEKPLANITEEEQKESEDKSKGKKQNNQKSLLSFFAKKSPRKSDINKILPKEKEERKALFRCIGSFIQNTYQQKFQTENNCKFSESFTQIINSQELNPIEILTLLKQETLRLKFSQRKSNQKQKSRKLFLFLNDSLRKYNGVVCDLVASRVKGRNPFAKEDCINYEVDSDEEFEEQNATDISSDEKEMDEEDEDDSEDNDEKFVVPDGYLSQEEKLDEDGEVETNRPLLNIQENMNIQSNKAFLFCFEKYQKGKDSNLDEFVDNFKVFQICSEELPIPVKKHKNNELNLKGDEVWSNEEVLKAFVRFVHGSFDNKPNIVNEFFSKNLNLSKASIERKMKEISKKEKLEGQTKGQYLVNNEIFETLKIELENDIILKEKIEQNTKKESESKKLLLQQIEEKEKEHEKEKEKEKEQEKEKEKEKKEKKRGKDESSKKNKNNGENKKDEEKKTENANPNEKKSKKTTPTTPLKSQPNNTNLNKNQTKCQSNITSFMKIKTSDKKP